MYNEWMSFRAKLRPDHVAVVVPTGPVRYGEFDAQIDKVATRLAALGIRAGGTVAVHVPDEYVHWLFVLALDRLGIGSASVGTLRPDNPFLAALKPALVVTVEKGRNGATATLEVTPEWLDETFQLPSSGPPQRRGLAGDVVRYFSSSGTTGTPKIMAVTRAMAAHRIDAEQLSAGIDAASRGCILIGPGNSGGYTWALGFWSAGASVVLNMGQAASIGRSLRRTLPSHLYLPVGTLVELVRDPAGADLQPMPSLSVLVVGSTLPRALAAQARKVLSPDIATKYGATEVAGIAVGATIAYSAVATFVILNVGGATASFSVSDQLSK